MAQAAQQVDNEGCPHLKNLTAMKWAWVFSLQCFLVQVFVRAQLPGHKATTASSGGRPAQTQILAEQLHMSTASSLLSLRIQRDPESKSPTP